MCTPYFAGGPGDCFLPRYTSTTVKTVTCGHYLSSVYYGFNNATLIFDVMKQQIAYTGSLVLNTTISNFTVSTYTLGDYKPIETFDNFT